MSIKEVVLSDPADSSEQAEKVLTMTRQQLEEIVEERTRELKQSNQLLAHTLNSISEMLFALDRDWRIIFWNSAAEQISGKKRCEVMGKNIWEVFNQSIGSDFYHQFYQAMEENKLISIEAYSKMYGIWLESRANPTPNGLIVFVKDISQYKQAEQELRLTSEHFRKAFDANPLSMAIISVKEGKVLKANEMFGVSTKYENDVRNPGFTDHIFWEKASDREEIVERIRREQIVKNLSANFLTKTGEVRNFLISAVSISWRGQEAILTISNDITELQRYQQELLQMDRLKLIGVTAAGIAHEIRNPLTTVKGFLQLFREREAYLRDREHIDLMIEELDRANTIIKEFLSLAKNKPGNLRWQDLNECIIKFMPLLEADAAKNDVYIRLDLKPLPKVLIDQDEMRQLILNLVQNAIDAMPHGGTITIQTYLERDEVVLSVQDQGAGISQDVIDKIGIPFFTTKNFGTGLGLAICYNIAYRSHARIEFNTSPEGTTFMVIFPGS